jgi:hypothetical protein
MKKSLVALCVVAAAALPVASFAGGVAVGVGVVEHSQKLSERRVAGKQRFDNR